MAKMSKIIHKEEIKNNEKDNNNLNNSSVKYLEHSAGFLNLMRFVSSKIKNGAKIKVEDEQIAKRFIQASRGWIKYKPLFQYITHKEIYKEKIQETYEKLKTGIIEVNKLFENEDCNVLLEDLTKYDKNVKKHYNEYLKTNEIWNKLKSEI